MKTFHVIEQAKLFHRKLKLTIPSECIYNRLAAAILKERHDGILFLNKVCGEKASADYQGAAEALLENSVS